MATPTNASGELYAEFRYKHAAAQHRAKAKFDEIDAEFQAAFGRGYGGQIEEYRTEDADIVFVSMGSQTGAIREVVDSRRARGEKLGLVKIKLFRPFPKERLAAALQGKKAVGVIDRNVNFGWQSGTVFMETKAALQSLPERVPVTGFIAGIGGMDLGIDSVERAVEIATLAAAGKPHQEVTWLNLE